MGKKYLFCRFSELNIKFKLEGVANRRHNTAESASIFEACIITTVYPPPKLVAWAMTTPQAEMLSNKTTETLLPDS
ncbi:MAG TPA: hypothetical protein VJN02_06170 [Gammaproteobacteria bacterium]|nr:hypothetical protein [Gammaproteobacteria bacterium]